MSAYTGQTPDAEPATTWQTQAACLSEDADLFFPDGTTGPWLLVIEQARAVCHRCPVADACLTFALDIGTTDGIFGGLTHTERANYRRSRTRRRRNQPTPGRAPQAAPKTLAEAFTRRTQRTDDGHILWYGSQQLKFQGVTYTSLQAAFIVGRGRNPEGPVRRVCGRECYRGDHLTDGLIRGSGEMCGTRQGYRAHRARGEDACDPCRQANTDADNQLRRTGTTKVSA